MLKLLNPLKGCIKGKYVNVLSGAKYVTLPEGKLPFSPDLSIPHTTGSKSRVIELAGKHTELVPLFFIKMVAFCLIGASIYVTYRNTELSSNLSLSHPDNSNRITMKRDTEPWPELMDLYIAMHRAEKNVNTVNLE